MSDRRSRWIDEARVLVVAGIPTGVIVVGLGSRLAMFVLRLTSPDSVRGVESDDGFTIGRFTLSGTLNLVMLGAAVGIIGAGVYRLVSKWLIGPPWFRRLTTGAAAAVVVGSMLVHKSGIDFNVLKPTWLAIGLFVLLPGVFGVAIGLAVDAVRHKAATSTLTGWRRWWLPILLIVCFPLSMPFLVVALLVLSCVVLLSDLDAVRRLRAKRGYALALRSCWLSIPVLGLVALIGDVRSLS